MRKTRHLFRSSLESLVVMKMAVFLCIFFALLNAGQCLAEARSNRSLPVAAPGLASNDLVGFYLVGESGVDEGLSIFARHKKHQVVNIGESYLLDFVLESKRSVSSIEVLVYNHKYFFTRKPYPAGTKKITFQGALPTIGNHNRILFPGKYKIEIKIHFDNGAETQVIIGFATILNREGVDPDSYDSLLFAHKNFLKSSSTIYQNVGSETSSVVSLFAKENGGQVETIPPPFEPVRLMGRTLKLWGRTIEINEYGFPRRIFSQEKDMLLNDVSLLFDGHSSSNNRLEDGKLIDFKFTDISDVSVSWISRIDHERFVTEVIGRLEYDGFLHYKIRILPEEEISLDVLALHVPLSSAVAKYYNHLPLGTKPLNKADRRGLIKNSFDGKDIEDGYTKLPFAYQYTVQDEEVGLAFSVETKRYWSNVDKEHVYSLERHDDSVSFEARFIDLSTFIDGPLELEFSLTILPVKPMKTWAEIAKFNVMQWPNAKSIYAKFFDQPQSVKKTQWFNKAGLASASLSAWDQSKLDGLKTMVVHQDWSDLQGYPGALSEERINALERFVHDAHSRNMKVVIYLGLELSTASPEWERYAGDWLRLPLRFGRSRNGVISFRPDGGTRGYSDFLIYRLKELIKKTDIDGVFLDLIPEPQVCINIGHGHGYVAEDGVYHGTLPVFENRRLLKKIYSLFHGHPKRDGIVIGHVGGAFRPGHAFLDYVVAGEDEVFRKKINSGEKLNDLMGLTKFRAIYNHYVWGVPLVWLTKPHKGGFDMSQNGSVTLLHNVLQRAQWPHFINKEASVSINNPIADVYGEWRVWEAFTSLGLDQGKWYPYWGNDKFVSELPENVYTSFWLIPGGKILAVVSNLSRDKLSFPIMYKYRDLGLRIPPLEVEDVVLGQRSKLEDGKLYLDLDAESYRLLLFE